MKGSFRLTKEAEDDLLSIWEFIAADDSETAADKVVAVSSMNVRNSVTCQALAIAGKTCSTNAIASGPFGHI